MGLSYFLVAVVFVLAPFITNDVSLVTFVPLTIILFRHIGKEKYTLPIVILENIAAITGAFLTPFGNPQNLFIYTNSEIAPSSFILTMLPLWLVALLGLSLAVRFIFRKDTKEKIYLHKEFDSSFDNSRRGLRVFYLALLVLLLFEIITSSFNFVDVAIIVIVSLLIFDRGVFKKVDYYLLSTFFFFFVFSSSIGGNERIGEYLALSVKGHEYWWGLLISQVISNVPGTALLFPFSENIKALLYGVNTAGMGTLVGSLASLITFTLFTKEYPNKKGEFLKVFHGFSLVFLIVLVAIYLILLR